MSRVEIHIIRKKPELKKPVIEYYGFAQNAWLGCRHIWDVIEEKYLPKFDMGPDHMNRYVDRMVASMCGKKLADGRNVMFEVWDLFDSGKLSKTEMILLGSTFDNTYIRYENIPILADACLDDEFVNDNLREQARIYKEIYEKFTPDDILGIYMNQNSVCCTDDAACIEHDPEDEQGWYYFLEDEAYDPIDETLDILSGNITEENNEEISAE